MTTTTITATMRRSYTADMFDDLNVGPHVRAWDKATGVTTLTFDAALDNPTAEAIRCRMTSRDDTDQAARATLKGQRDAVVSLANAEQVDTAALVAAVADLAVMATNYALGD